MTNKIIIDGVDVAGCEFYDNGYCRECDMRVPFYSDIDCDNRCNRNCIYKQLKRLAQENEQVKELKDKYYIEKLDREAQLSYCIQALEEIREILKGNKDGDIDEMIDKINEVLR